MTESKLHLELATPQGLMLAHDCSYVAAPSVNGELGVLPGHLPVLASLKSGVLHYVAEDGTSHRAAVGPGFVQVECFKVELLTEHFVVAKDIDKRQAEKDVQHYESELSKVSDDNELRELTLHYEWARARLNTLTATA